MKIIVEKSKKLLTLYDDLGEVLMTSRVITHPTETPEGTFSISSAILNPGWQPTTSMCIKEGICDYIKPRDKRNPMGDVKIQVKGTIYLHYTNHPEAFNNSKAQSHGCVRTESIHKLVEILAGVKREEYGKTTNTKKFTTVPIIIQ